MMNSPNIKAEPVTVSVQGGSDDGRLVYVDDCLVAIVVKLSTADGGLCNRWYVEAMFGSRAPAPANLPVVDTLEEALAWIALRLGLPAISAQGGSIRRSLGS